jgi:predicted nuclease of predicted toxin-antitoxin system
MLLDENLSPRLPALSADRYPGSQQVEQADLRGATDSTVWEYAQTGGDVLFTKNNDFRQRSFQYGAPPKVAWLSVGSGGTSLLLRLLRASKDEIEAFVAMPEAALLILSPRPSSDANQG